MRPSPRTTNLLLILAGVIIMGLAGRQNSQLVSLRAEHNLVEEIDPLVGASPWVRFIQVGLGGFRGILVDILWTRATRLQDDHQYFELTQLADWISKLEPRVPEVWAFHAWNQAYNISVLFNTPHERWQWVRNGITLLRDEGLRYNPNSPKLHWELGWMYQHKMGADLDTMHGMYKLYWANEMATLFPSNAPPYAVWTSYPDTAEELAENTAIRSLINTLENAGYAPTEDPFLDEFLGRPVFPKNVIEAFEADPVALQKLLTFLRKQRLQKVYKLELSTMKEVDDKYGPFDWRLPQAHSTYWAYRGMKRTDEKQGLRLHRMIYQSMASSFRYGSFTIIDEHLPPDFSPNLAILDNTMMAYEEALEEYKNVAVEQAHSNLLVDAIMILSEYGQRTRAQEIYEDYTALYPAPKKLDYESFVLQTMFSEGFDALGQDEATHIVEGKLREAYVYLAAGLPDRAEGFFYWAKRVYDKFSTRANDEAQRLKWTRTWNDFREQARQDALRVFRNPEKLDILEQEKIVPTESPPALN